MSNPEEKTLKVMPVAHAIARRLSKIEQRHMRIVVERALIEYAKKHAPAALQPEGAPA